MTRRQTNLSPGDDDRHLSHDVRMWSIRAYEGKRVRTYSVRWAVAGREHHETFASRALADSYRAKLLTFLQRGIPFDRSTGLPEPMLRDLRTRSWFDHACAYVDMKWPNSAPKSRRSIAEALTTVTPALLSSTRGQPPASVVRDALHKWAFVSPARAGGPPPDRLAAALRWLERNTINLADLEDRTKGPELVRAALDAIATRLDGGASAPNTIARKRAVLYNALGYAVELGLLRGNPIDSIQWKKPKAVQTVDRQVVVNPQQARALLEAVGAQGRLGRRLVPFFALMYYAALRPSEALGLRQSRLVSMPDTGWGEILLGRSAPRSGKAWTNNGATREERGLKHRAEGETRPVPAHPELVAILTKHVRQFGIPADGRLFFGPLGGAIEESTYFTIWQKARLVALTPEEAASPLARRPYDLRHAAVSTWLNAGVPPTQVAEWAGHSVAVLLRTYAKCVSGTEGASRRRIFESMCTPST